MAAGDDPVALRAEIERLEAALRSSKEATAEAAAARARLEGIFEAAVDGIVTIDETGTIESVNAATTRIFGYAAEELVGHNVKKLMPRPVRDEHDAHLERYRRTGERHIIGIGREVTGRRADGSEFPLELSVAEVRDGSRRLFTGTIKDTTERRAAEKEIRESYERLRAILDSAVDGIIAIDETGTIREVNPAVEAIFGYRPDELVGEDVRILMPPPFDREHDGYVRRYLETGEARIIGSGREVLGRRKDGSTFPHYLAVSE
ncbi:MAG TPA: PAS domain S-box protein, partial [Myxococcota bacterium]|nr:PAS domain S-box protein [Myxococcota bacterium]